MVSTPLLWQCGIIRLGAGSGATEVVLESRTKKLKGKLTVSFKYEATDL